MRLDCMRQRKRRRLCAVWGLERPARIESGSCRSKILAPQLLFCNNVLLIVPREQILPACGRSIESQDREPGSYLGEIPFVAGLCRNRVSILPARPSLTSTGAVGCEHAWEWLAEWFIGSMSGKPIVIRSGTRVAFYAGAEEFIAMATRPRAPVRALLASRALGRTQQLSVFEAGARRSAILSGLLSLHWIALRVAAHSDSRLTVLSARIDTTLKYGRHN
jgi:hypothetical protein